MCIRDRQAIVRSRLEGLGPTTVSDIASTLALSDKDVEIAILALEQQGFVVRGRFNEKTNAGRSGDVSTADEWCERRLLSRINRYTIKGLRKKIRAVSPAQYMRFLTHWHGLIERPEGYDALLQTLGQLEGCAIAAGAWENEVLRSRLTNYNRDL